MIKSHKLACLVATVLFAIGCDGSSAKQPPAQETPSVPEASREIVVAIDRSASQSSRDRLEQEAYLKAIIDSLRFGDRLILFRIHERGAADISRFRWETTMPEIADGSVANSADEEDVEDRRDGAWTVARKLLADSSKIMATDIIGTLYAVSEDVADGARPRVLIVLSDMLQSDDTIEMEGLRRMPAAGWIAKRKEQGLIRPLAGVCVGVVGADASNGDGTVVKEFWKEYFSASGAVILDRNYRLQPPQKPIPDC